GIGGAGTFLRSDGTDPSWIEIEISDVNFLQSNLDDISVLISTKQPLDADLTAIAGLTRTRGDLIIGGASAWIDLAIGSANRVLRSDGTDPSWGQVALAT